MKSFLRIASLATLTWATPALAAGDPPHSDVQIYRAAPGHQVALLKFLAGREAAAKAAGQPASTLYVHTSGASWDYVLISPHISDAQGKAQDDAASRMGLAIGPKMGLEFRQHIAEHSDTETMGPMSVSDYLALIGE